MKHKITIKKIMLIIFAFIIGIGFISNISNLITVEKRSELADSSAFETGYNEQFFMRKDLINLNGLVRKGMNQKIVNETIKAKDGQLFLISDTEYIFDESEEQKKTEKALHILEAAKENGAEILYVQHPGKYREGRTELPYGLKCEYDKQYDYWCTCMHDYSIPTFDLRIKKSTTEFYKTDHHWTCESAFWAAKFITDELRKNDTAIRSISDDYQVEHYAKTFLGSEGVRTGEWYAGKDDFNVIVPDDNSIYHLEQIIDNKVELSKEGQFKETFVDQSLIDDANYYNKYNAFLYGGYVENIIVNEGCDDNSKLLLISDSFARSMVMYLCQAFHETRYLDPQEGRYNKSYIDYIEKYKPDVVVMMYTGDFVKE